MSFGAASIASGIGDCTEWTGFRVSRPYNGSLAADHKVSVAQRLLDEAAGVLSDLKKRREYEREDAHADLGRHSVQRSRGTRRSRMQSYLSEKARLDLAVLCFQTRTRRYAL